MNTLVISSHLSLLLFVFLLVGLAACGQAASPATGTLSIPTPTTTVALDVYGTPIVFPKTAPQRIVSLVSSTSEILGALHLERRVVGNDCYTDYPPALSSLPISSNIDGKSNAEQVTPIKP